MRSIADGSRSRFLRAELERRAGDVEVAKAYYAGLDESWSWWDTGFRPRLYRALAEIAAEQDRKEAAAGHYEKLLELLQHADPVLEEERTAARAALDALGS